MKVFGLILLLILVSSAPPTDAKCSFQAIFNFGDSNSETGGYFAAFGSQRGPFGMTYFKKPAGRASDGRAVIDFLAQALGLPFLSPYLQSIGSNFRHGANFATASSTVMLPNTSMFVSGISPFALPIQLNQFMELRQKVLEMRPQGYLPPQNIFGLSLYTLDIGQNDFSRNLATMRIDGVNKFLRQVASQIGWTIKDLYDIGGRAFLVMNLAPVGCFPALLTELPHNASELDAHGCMISYNKAVVDYNIMLKGVISQTQNELKDAAVIYVDTHSIKLELFQHPKDHGFMYGTKACCGYGGGHYNFYPQVYCGNSKIINGINITATACSDPQDYVSWDGIHATDAANKIVASAILNGSNFYPSFPLSKLCKLHQIG